SLSSTLNSAVVEVTSVQPTSDRRTVRQASPSSAVGEAAALARAQPSNAPPSSRRANRARACPVPDKRVAPPGRAAALATKTPARVNSEAAIRAPRDLF